MIDTAALTSTVIKLFVVVLIGFAAAKFGYADKAFTKKLSNFVICVAQPFMIVSSLAKVEFSLSNLTSGFTVTAIGFVTMLISALIAKLVTFKFKKQDERRLSEFALIFANTGFMGFPVLNALFGDLGEFYGAFFIITFHITLWTYGIHVLSKCKTDIKVKPINMFFNFGTVPVMIGLILYVLPFRLPDPMLSAFDMVGDLCSPLSMLIIGATVATISMKDLFLDLKVYLVTAVRLFVTPAIVCCLAALVGLSDDLVYLFTTFTALPAATNVAMYAQKFDIDPGYGAKLPSLSTLLTVISVPLMIAFAGIILSLRA